MFYGDPNRGLVSASYGIVQVCQTLVLLLLRRLRGCSVREGDLGRNSAGNVGRGWMRWKRMPHLRYGPLPASKTLPVHWPARRETPGGPQFPVCVRKGLGFSQSQLNPSVGFPFVPARWTFVFFHWVWALGGPQFPVGATNKQTSEQTNGRRWPILGHRTYGFVALRPIRSFVASLVISPIDQSCWPRGS